MVQMRSALARAHKHGAQTVPALFAIAPRVDLRTGAVAAGVTSVEAPMLSGDWIAVMGDARQAWAQAGYNAPLSCAAPIDCIADAAHASDLDSALRAAGFAMRQVTLEIDEATLIASNGQPMAALERLRARGWGVALRSAPDCPLALGGRTRTLFTDVMTDAPQDLTPFLGLEGYDDQPLARRVRAASNAGLNVTATNLNSVAQSGLLIAAGFDRGQGPGVRSHTFG
jgi:hypothetical protein